MKDYVTALSALAIAAAVYVSSDSVAVDGGGLAKDPAYYPRALALLLAGLAVGLLVKALLSREKPGVTVNKELLLNVGQIFGLIFFYILAFQYIGFLTATLAFLVCGILLYGGSVKSALLCGVPVTAGVYVVFHIFMKVPLPQGVLF